MHILVVYYFYKSKISGVGDVIEAYCQELLRQRSDVRITVLCQNVNNESETQTIDGVDIIRFESSSIASGRIPLPSLDLWQKLNQILECQQIDQIHLHTRFSTSTVVGLLAGKKHKVKTVHFEHLSNFILGEKPLLQNACWLWDQTISRWMFSQADQIVAISDSVKRFICNNLGVNSSKVVVIPNGCRFVANSLPVSSKFAIKRKYNLLFAARLVPLKNPLLTLQVIQALSQIRQDFVLTIAGAGELEVSLKNYIRQNNLSQFVTLVGSQNSTQMSELFGQNDIFLNLSYLEGLPGGVMEALFNNNICVVSDVGGNNDLITDPNCLVQLPTATSQSIAKQLDFILNNLALVSQSTESDKQKASQVNNWSTFAKVMIKELF
jgi:glycosyltransferase involved in cell wall biosynthesis